MYLHIKCMIPDGGIEYTTETNHCRKLVFLGYQYQYPAVYLSGTERPPP